MLGDLAFGLLVVAALLGTAESEDVGYANGGSGGYPGNGSHGSGYPTGSGYPRGSGYSGGAGYPGGPKGFGGYGGGYFPQFIPAPIIAPKKKKLTEVDKMFSRLTDVSFDLHMVKERLENLKTRLAILNRKKEESNLQLQTLTNDDNEESAQLDSLGDQLDAVDSLLTDTGNIMNTVNPLNDGNTDNLMAEGARLAIAFHDNTDQAGRIADLAAQMPVLRQGLNELAENSFQYLCNAIDVEQEVSLNLENLAGAHRCETGTLTIHREDKRSTALFQTSFGEQTPNIIWGINGYSFNLNARPDSEQHHPPYGGGYGYGYGGSSSYEPPEPNAMGVLVNADPSPDGITFHLNDMAFGDTALKAVKVNYQACNIMLGNPLL